MNRFLGIFAIIVFSFCFSYTKKENNQRAFYECTEPLDIDTSLFKTQHGKNYFYFNTELEPTALKSKGFRHLDDHPTDYFTAYLINTSRHTFHAFKQDGSLIIIQEAMDETGVWKPIEYWVSSRCGNSYTPLTIDSGKYVMIPIKKYQGGFKTKIRLKMKKGTTIFYSEAFEGRIEKSQFNKETKMVNGVLYHGPADYLDD